MLPIFQKKLLNFKRDFNGFEYMIYVPQSSKSTGQERPDVVEHAEYLNLDFWLNKLIAGSCWATAYNMDERAWQYVCMASDVKSLIFDQNL